MGRGRGHPGPLKLVQVAVTELEKIAGQKVMVTKARKAIGQFKIRENQPSAPR